MEIDAPLQIIDTIAPAIWNSEGRVKFIDYSARYRKEDNLALENINFETDKHEKVGICGGKGKIYCLGFNRN